MAVCAPFMIAFEDLWVTATKEEEDYEKCNQQILVTLGRLEASVDKINHNLQAYRPASDATPGLIAGPTTAGPIAGPKKKPEDQ